jgi:hypothetical protein
MNPLWYAKRLARMSPTEVLRRGRDSLIKLLWRAEWARPDAAMPRTTQDVARFKTPLPREAAEAVPAVARDGLVAAAQGILEGQWRVFEVDRKDLIAPDWFLDPRSGRRAPELEFSFGIDHRDVQRAGNPKYVWDLSRHHHLTLLAAAYFLTGDERYPARVVEHLTSWWRQNPFLSGVHWTSGIELGLRLISWVWIRRLLDASPVASSAFEQNPVFLQQLLAHQWYLATLPSHDSSANNHLIAEAAGQFIAASAFPYFPESSAWRDKAAAILRREIPRQTFQCGLNREQASDYHGFVIELCLAAVLEGETSCHSLGSEIWTLIRRMIDALASIVDMARRPPRQGDSDGAWGLLLDRPDFDRWSSILATGSRLFGAPSWWPPVPNEDVRTTLWTALTPKVSVLGERPATRTNLLGEAGLTILRDQPQTAEEIWCACDHGTLGYLSIAGHGHADALAVECRYGGVEILVDPGTYCYYGQPEWRAYFRSTIAHNTLRVRGLDQSVPGGPFLWLHHARARLLSVEGLAAGPTAEWQAEHDGYARLQPPAIHRRTGHLDREARCLTLTDQLLTEGVHPCELAFHLGVSVTVSLLGTRATLVWPERSGMAIMELPSDLEWVVIRGQHNPPLGWYSPAFGMKQPTSTLLGRGHLEPGRLLITRLQFGQRASPPIPGKRSS